MSSAALDTSFSLHRGRGPRRHLADGAGHIYAGGRGLGHVALADGADGLRGIRRIRQDREPHSLVGHHLGHLLDALVRAPPRSSSPWPHRRPSRPIPRFVNSGKWMRRGVPRAGNTPHSPSAGRYLVQARPDRPTAPEAAARSKPAVTPVVERRLGLQRRMRRRLAVSGGSFLETGARGGGHRYVNDPWPAPRTRFIMTIVIYTSKKII